MKTALRVLSNLVHTDQNRARAIFENALDAILIADDNGFYIDANPAACELFGCPREQLIGRHLTEFAEVGACQQARGQWRQFRRDQEQQGEFTIRRADGELRVLEFRAKANFLPGQHMSILRDITERKNAEKEAIRARQKLDRFMSQSVAGLVITRLSGEVLEANDQFLNMLGYTREEFEQNKITWQNLTPPEFQEVSKKAVSQLKRSGRAQPFEKEYLRKDGSRIPVLVAATLIDDECGECITVVLDLSEKKKIESLLLMSDRMIAMGTLAAGVAHEVNNPLAFILTNLDLLSEEVRDSEKAGKLVRAISEGVVRIRDIVRNLKSFSRPDDRLTPVDITEIVELSLTMADNEIRHRATVKRDYRAAPKVTANKTRLGQVFLNLLINAAQAIREGRSNENEICVLIDQNENGEVVVQIKDSGCGMSEQTLKRAFEPFFTTKPLGEGTGLGLAMCHGIIRGLGGRINVESEYGRGSTFTVVLPPSDGKEQAHANEVVSAIVSESKGAKVLLVDDEVELTAALTNGLKKDHMPQSVNSAMAALDLLEREKEFDVIFCDLMMPDMSGVDFYEQVKKRFPHLADRIVFITGGAFTSRTQEFLHEVPNMILEKPFGMRDLREAIQCMLKAKDAI